MVESTGQLETNPVKRFFTRKPPGLRPRIDAMCATCVCVTATEQGEGMDDYQPRGWRTEICRCPVLSCPLHEVRPFQNFAPETEPETEDEPEN